MNRLDYILASLRRAGENGYSWSVSPDEAGALRAEVERLRGEVSYLRACVPPVHPADYGHEVWTETVRAQVAAERAAVVAALRRFEPGPMGLSLVDMASVADAIERGEHRREGDK